jgi:hypothetical protein
MLARSGFFGRSGFDVISGNVSDASGILRMATCHPSFPTCGAPATIIGCASTEQEVYFGVRADQILEVREKAAPARDAAARLLRQ